ncbi:MAG: flagellar hook-associated protein FlgK [Rhodoferax sp.]
MSDIAGIAGNAVAAYQNALSTVSNNIANVATDGYSRQDVSLSALPVTKSGGLFLGSGVAVNNVKRQYDAFVQSNLRNTNSDFSAQGPMVNYANRVVDVMGGQTMGLNTALDQFFSSARALSADTSSTVLRSSFVRDAQGVAQRFGQLSQQLSLIESETRSAVDDSVAQMNTLTKQLGVVNAQLTKQMTEASQPPDLLDQRDLLLQKLSTLAHVNTAFSTNGQVTVSLGPTVTQDVVVSGTTVTPIGADYNSASQEKVALVLDPYGKSTPLSGITSGTLSGLMAFRSQVLSNTQSALDNLAKTFVDQTNAIHEQGIDAYGKPGQALFAIDPTAANAAGAVSVTFDDPLLVAAAAQFRVTEGADNTSGTHTTLNYVDPAAPPGKEPPALSTALVNNDHPSAAKVVTVSRSIPATTVAIVPSGMQDVSIYLDSLQPGQQLQVLTRDGRQLIGQSMAGNTSLLGSVMTQDNGFAAGASYSDAYLNNAKQSVQITGTANGPVSFLGVALAGSTAGNSATVTAAAIVAQKTRILAGSAAMSGGVTDIALDPNDPSKLLLTTLPTTPARTGVAAATSAGVTYSAGTDLSYKGMDVFYGAQARVQLQPVYNSKDQVSGSKPFPALLQGTRVQPMDNGVAANTLTLNGVALAPLAGPINDAVALANWINTQSTQTGVQASASNEIRLQTKQLDLTTSSLVLNGVTVNTASMAAPQDLVDAINAAPSSNVRASLTNDGQFVLTNAAGHEGENITVTNLVNTGSPNSLGISGGVYRGTLSITQPLNDANGTPITKPIQLGFGSAGSPADLTSLGFRTGAFISGKTKDDLVVLITGPAGAATVSASYSGQAVDHKQELRGNPMKIAFLSDTHYQITDTSTNTVVAERTLDPTVLSPGISFQGLQLSFTAAPKRGDVFTMDGNTDGVGNNENMLALNQLESKAVVGNKTLSNAYIDHVNEMGNVAHQATISQTALKVVHDQAVTSHDQIAGVSLDKEAGDLIRYQHAYQAAAKALQVAGQWFDSVLQIR